jgi:hypothetical protein
MRKLVLALACLILAVGFSTGLGHDKDSKDLKELMRRKLKYGQKVLEGLALNDFEVITSSAEELIQVSKAAEWKVVKTPRYEVYSNEFRRNAETMIENAKAKNLDGATLAYVDMTLTCVKCHKHVREVRMGRLDGRKEHLARSLDGATP